MKKSLSKKEKIQIALFAVSVILIIFGILFVLTAGKVTAVFPAFYNIEHQIVQYIIVIVTMASGIMLFSNVAATLENPKKRNKFTIGITAFSTILTLPLLYVFIALYPAMNGKFGSVGEFMVKDIAADFQMIFQSEAVQCVIYAAGILLSIIFLTVPILSAAITVKNKQIKIGKGGIKIVEKTLPVTISEDQLSNCLAESAADEQD